MPLPADEQYVPDPVPNPQDLPAEIYTQIACPDDGAEIKAAHVRRISEAAMTNDAIIRRETGILEDAQAFNVAIGEQVFTADRHYWYLDHDGPVVSDYEFGFNDNDIALPKLWWFNILGFNLNEGTTIAIRRDLPGAPTPPVIKFNNGSVMNPDEWFFMVTLININGRLMLGSYNTNGAVDLGGCAPFD